MESKTTIGALLKQIENFIEIHSCIYLYGAGDFSGKWQSLLKKMKYKFHGLIVSEKREDVNYEFPVLSMDDTKDFIPADCGIILALSDIHHEDVKTSFLSFPVDIFALDDESVLYLYDYMVLYPLCKLWSRRFPPLPLPEKNDEWSNILVIRIDVLGDMLMTIPFLRELRKNYPNSKITLLLHKQNYELMKTCPYITRLLIYEGGLNDCVNENELLAFAEDNLISEQFDAVLTPREFLCGRNLAVECLLTFFCGARYRVARMRKFVWRQRLLYPLFKPLFSQMVYQEEPMHEVLGMLDMLDSCGLKIEDTKMEYWLSSKDKEFARDFFSPYLLDGDEILIAVGLVSRDCARTWSASKYMNLMTQVSNIFQGKIGFVLFGGTDACEAEKIVMQADGHLIDAVGKTGMIQAAALMEWCDIYLGSNTGLLHFAAALGKEVVEISAELPDGKETDDIHPLRMGAWGVRSFSVMPRTISGKCSGYCRKPYPHCIDNISVEEVANVLNRAIAILQLRKE